jgi:RNA polymerase sigma-70 factor, ECF subfamily
MKAEKTPAVVQTEMGDTSPARRNVRQGRDHGLIRLPEKAIGSTVSDIHCRMVNILPRLRRFVHSLTNGANFSEDLVQETYVRALAHLDQWQPGSRLDSWMFRIARNLWIDQMRSEKSRGEVIDIEVVDHLLSCDGQLLAENRLLLEALRRDIAELPEEQRNVINLIWFYGMSYKETGKLLDVPAGTVMSRMARVRGALQKFI